MCASLRCTGVALLVLGALVAACSAENRLPTELEIPAFALEGQWDGEFVYEYDEAHDYWRCFYNDPDGVHTPNGTRYQFECGKLLLGLKAGVTPEDLQDLFDAIDATFIRTGLPEPYTFASVRVPMRSEREALLVASRDPRLRYASLNFSGPAECGMVGGCRSE
ncbi:MAG: hypothetical protein ACREM1_02550 [Longimicrobiales bacterium]